MIDTLRVKKNWNFVFFFATECTTLRSASILFLLLSNKRISRKFIVSDFNQVIPRKRTIYIFNYTRKDFLLKIIKMLPSLRNMHALVK